MRIPSIKIILVDGVSNVGKTTFINAIKDECIENRVFVHYIHPTKNIIESPYKNELVKTQEVLERANGLLKSLVAFETDSVTGLTDEAKEQTIYMIRMGLLNAYVDSIHYSLDEVMHTAGKKEDLKHVIIMDRSFLTGLVYNNIFPDHPFFRREDGHVWWVRLRWISNEIESKEEISLHSILVTGPVRAESEENKEAFDTFYDNESKIKKETYESLYRRYQEIFFFNLRNHYSMVFENNGSLKELTENAKAMIKF